MKKISSSVSACSGVERLPGSTRIRFARIRTEPAARERLVQWLLIEPASP
jgi:hypothetical protein